LREIGCTILNGDSVDGTTREHYVCARLLINFDTFFSKEPQKWIRECLYPQRPTAIQNKISGNLDRASMELLTVVNESTF